MKITAVCGRQVMIFGKVKNRVGERHLIQTRDFAHYGHAKEFSREFDEAQKRAAEQAVES